MEQDIERPSIWRNGDFVRYWLASTVSSAGSALTAVVLPILVFQLTGSALQTALLATFQTLPYFAFGLFAGALADRVDRRRLMLICELANGVLLASIPLAAWLGWLSLPQIYLVAALSMFCFVWFDAASFGAIPAVVGRERITEATSVLMTTSTLTAIATPALGGLLAALVGPAYVVSLDAVSFVFSGLVLLSIRRAFNPPRTSASGSGVVRRTFADIREGFAFLWNQPIVRTMTLIGTGNSLTGGAIQGLLIVFAVRALGIPETDGRLGLLYAFGAAGALLASVSLPRLTRRLAPGWVTIGALATNIGALVLLVVAPHLWVALGAYLVWHAAYTLTIINAVTVRMTVTPDALQGRVNMTGRMIAWGGAPIGAALGGAIAEFAGVRGAYAVMACGVLLSLLAAWFSPLRTYRVER